MRVSIVIPVYNGARTIGPLVDSLLEEVHTFELEIVLVNDGSADDSHEECQRIFDRYPKIVTYIELARNFGEHNAVMAGLSHSSGDYVVIMDDDFQNPPSQLVKLLDEARRGNYDVVYTFYPEKRHSRLRNLGSEFNNWVAHLILNKPRDLYLSSFKCLDRFLVEEILKYRGPHPYIDGLVLSSTSNIGRICVTHDARSQGTSGYTFRKLVRLWLNMFLNFSAMPLRVASVLGLSASLFAFLLGILFVAEKIVSPGIERGWASLAVLIVFFSGIQLCTLGLIGEYVARTLMNMNRLPQYVVRSIFQKKANSGHR